MHSIRSSSPAARPRRRSRRCPTWRRSCTRSSATRTAISRPRTSATLPRRWAAPRCRGEDHEDREADVDLHRVPPRSTWIQLIPRGRRSSGSGLGAPPLVVRSSRAFLAERGGLMYVCIRMRHDALECVRMRLYAHCMMRTVSYASECK